MGSRIIELIANSFSNLWSSIMDVMPNLLVVLSLIIVAWAIAKIISIIIKFILKKINLDEKLGKVKHLFSYEKLGTHPSKIISGFIYWVIFLTFIATIAQIQGWYDVSNKLSTISAYLPHLIGGIILFVIGYFIARLVKNILYSVLTSSGINYANTISKVTFYILMVIVLVILLNELGFNTSIISNNISIILGSLLFSFAITFAMAAKDVLRDILSSAYNKSLFKEGQKISIEGTEGEIVKITNTSVLLRTNKSIRVIAAHKFLKLDIDIIG